MLAIAGGSKYKSKGVPSGASGATQNSAPSEQPWFQGMDIVKLGILLKCRRQN